MIVVVGAFPLLQPVDLVTAVGRLHGVGACCWLQRVFRVRHKA